MIGEIIIPFYINPERKVRIALSEKARMTIEEDMLIWNIDKLTTFINNVFYNYKEEAQSSIEIIKEKRYTELSELFVKHHIEPQTRDNIINIIINKECEDLENKTKEYIKRGGESKIYGINKSNNDYLTSDQCNENKNYKDSLGKYMQSVIEEYCDLPYIEREKIFFKDIFEKINLSIAASRVLLVTTTSNDSFYVVPYRIEPDTLNTRNYLACYSKKKSSKDQSTIDPSKISKIASFKISNIASVTLQSNEFELSIEQKNKIEKEITTNSIPYLLQKNGQKEVKLTKKGQKIYKTKLLNRPTKIDEKDDIYVFDCSNRQILNYFSSFGEEAEIISPPELRKNFIKNLQNTLDNYLTNNEKQ